VIKLIKVIALNKRVCIIRVNNQIKGTMKIIQIMWSLEIIIIIIILGVLRIISNSSSRRF